MIQRAQVERLIKIALQEDMNNGDITTDMLIESDKVSEAKLIVKQDGVLAGIKVFESVFEYLDNTIHTSLQV